MNTKRKDMRGQKFWMLTAERQVRTAKDGSTVWRWRCECGKVRDAVTAQVKSGRIKSCGCRKRAGSWSTSEELVLRRMYPTTPNRKIGELLGRREQSVHSRATLLGLLKAVGHVEHGGLYMHDSIEYFGASPDRRVGEKGLLEAKNFKPENHYAILRQLYCSKRCKNREAQRRLVQRELVVNENRLTSGLGESK